DLFEAIHLALDGGQGDIVDLRVGAPERAAGGGDLELARQVYEFGIAGEAACELLGQRAGIDQLMSVKTGERAAGDVAHHIAAGALGAESDLVERLLDLNNALQSEPVELDVLAGGDVGEVVGVLLRQLADEPQLLRGEQAV